MKSQFITYKNSTIHYCVWGNGLKLLFCFHGYGEQAESFAILEPTLGNDYTMIAIDMPFHGQTEWREGLEFTDDDLIGVMENIQERMNDNGKVSSSTIRAADSGGRAFSLLGYSMGGRVALQLLQKIPASIERAVLVAPDGLHKNVWYRFATQSFVGNKFFKYIMHRPQDSFSFLNVAEKYKLVHAGLLKIVRYYTDAPEERKRLYCRWTTMRKFKPNLHLLKKLIKHYSIPTRFLFGRFDNIIISSRANIFKDDVKNIQIHIADAGHRLLQEKYIPAISALFYQ